MFSHPSIICHTFKLLRFLGQHPVDQLTWLIECQNHFFAVGKFIIKISDEGNPTKSTNLPFHQKLAGLNVKMIIPNDKQMITKWLKKKLYLEHPVCGSQNFIRISHELHWLVEPSWQDSLQPSYTQNHPDARIVEDQDIRIHPNCLSRVSLGNKNNTEESVRYTSLKLTARLLKNLAGWFRWISILLVHDLEIFRGTAFGC